MIYSRAVIWLSREMECAAQVRRYSCIFTVLFQSNFERIIYKTSDDDANSAVSLIHDHLLNFGIPVGAAAVTAVKVLVIIPGRPL